MTETMQEEALPGTIHTLTPHDLAVSGGSVAKLAGLTVFLNEGLPGSVLRCRITERKPRFAMAEVLETLTPSPDEVPSFCSFSARCGGCAWTNFRYEAQLAWKERHVKETLRRIGKVDFSITDYQPILPSPRQERYRNKMEFAFGWEDDSPALGLRQKNSHAVVSVTECALAALPVQSILATTRAWMEESGLPPFAAKKGCLRFLVIRCPDYAPQGSPRCQVECITSPVKGAYKTAVEELGRRLMATAPVTDFIHSVRENGANIAYGGKVVFSLGGKTIQERFGDIIVEAPAQAFLQANTEAATLVYGLVREYAENAATVFDLYCGVGSIALNLAREGRRIWGIESVAEAVRFARKNAATLPGETVFIHGEAARMQSEDMPRPDLIVTDPPRAGMDAQTIQALLTLHPQRIVAVSCDAASLARDLALLGAAYTVTRVRAVDMFPHTPHVEMVAVLEKRS